MGSCAAPSAKGDDKFITTDYLQQCPAASALRLATPSPAAAHFPFSLLS
ncbi:replication initiator protein [Salmonella enterica]|nr:replication initiator protein [Salmonella enterica]EEH7176924.1 replication initiator protein [Salmonella enterica subsp. enterica]